MFALFEVNVFSYVGPSEKLTVFVIAAKKLPKSEPGGRSAQQGTVTVAETQGNQKSGCCGGK